MIRGEKPIRNLNIMLYVKEIYKVTSELRLMFDGVWTSLFVYAQLPNLTCIYRKYKLGKRNIRQHSLQGIGSAWLHYASEKYSDMLVLNINDSLLDKNHQRKWRVRKGSDNYKHWYMLIIVIASHMLTFDTE